MHGNHSLLMLDLANLSHKEQIAKVERYHAVAQASGGISHSRLGGVRNAVGASLIAAGERLRAAECELVAEDSGADHLSLNLAR